MASPVTVSYSTGLPGTIGDVAVTPTTPLPVTGVAGGSITAIAPVVATASLTALASLATTQQLLAANSARQGLILVNTDANNVKIKYGTTASATSFTAIVPANGGIWEMPYPVYTGRIDAIWDADGAGSLYATEM